MYSEEFWQCDICNKCFQYKSDIRNHLKGHSDLGGICGLNINNTIVITEEPHENVISGSTNISKQKQDKERGNLKIYELRSEARSDAQNVKNLENINYNEDFEHALKAALGSYKPRQARYFKNLDSVMHKCKMCPYMSIHTSGLSSHKRIWHKERIWHFCNICDYKTVVKKCLIKHMLTIHPDLRFSCSQCEFKAAYRKNLKVHLESKHSDFKYICGY